MRLNNVLLSTIVLLLLLCSCRGYDTDTYSDKVFDLIDEELTTQEDVENWIATNISGVLDIDQYGVSDYWASPIETLTSRQGDCEDYVILYLYLLYKVTGEKASAVVLLLDDGAYHLTVEDSYHDYYMSPQVPTCIISSYEYIKTYSYDYMLYEGTDNGSRVINHEYIFD